MRFYERSAAGRFCRIIAANETWLFGGTAKKKRTAISRDCNEDNSATEKRRQVRFQSLRLFDASGFFTGALHVARIALKL